MTSVPPAPTPRPGILDITPFETDCVSRLSETTLPPALVKEASATLAHPAAAVDLAAHKALYDLTLASAHGDVTAAFGTMSFEVGDACDGWTVRQRLRMMVTDNEGHDIEMVSDYATWEAKNGLSFSFHMKQMTEGASSSQTDGTAKLSRRGGPGDAGLP